METSHTTVPITAPPLSKMSCLTALNPPLDGSSETCLRVSVQTKGGNYSLEEHLLQLQDYKILEFLP